MGLLALLTLGLAGCDSSATPTPILLGPTATPVRVQPAPPTVPRDATLPTAVGTVPTEANLPTGPATPGPGGGDQPLPTTSPGVVVKPTGPPGTLTLPTAVPTAPTQNLPNPAGTVGPGGVDPVPPDEVAIGKPAPDFTVTRLDTGEDVRLSDFQGHPVWINFWATWCPPCKEEMPQMQAIYQEHKDSDLVILGVDFREEADVVRPFVAEGKFGWTFLLDSDARAAIRYYVSGIPVHVFVTRDGTIQDIVTAGLDHAGMERQVAALLKP